MKVRIESNPYDRKITFASYDVGTGIWKNIRENNPNSRLREDESAKNFLPFRIKEILDVIVEEYYIGQDMIEIVFEGTQDEREEVKEICNDSCYQGKLFFSEDEPERMLSNARYIFKDIKNEFEEVEPIIEKVMNRNMSVKDNLDKVKSTLDDMIPICVFGNYSAGKSTFINALLGCEILPSGGDPVTAKVYQIANSDQPDKSEITYTYLGKDIKLIFEGELYRYEAEDTNSDLLQEINAAISNCEKTDLYAKVNVALELINSYERKDKDVIVISDVIDIKIPFSKKGILGQSRNNFVIFDTPGSNSASNNNHTKVLENALARFSNGIPVWVTTYESIDSTDNLDLCEKILKIKALDERFTMIIMNKADGSNLPRGGFDYEKKKEILEFNSVEKMYSSGIYFVSSIMGIGAKRDGDLRDDFYAEKYFEQKLKYEDPANRFAKILYAYNIMPETFKNKLVGMSEQYPDKIYANSGLYGIETSMETFASKYAAYNKCQMVYLFLDNVIDDTNKEIDRKTAFLEENRKKRQNELDAAKAALLQIIAKEAQITVGGLVTSTDTNLKGYINEHLRYVYHEEMLHQLASSYRASNAEANHYEVHEKDFEDDRNSMWSHFKINGQEILHGKLSSIKNLASDLAKDRKEVQESKVAKENIEREIDKATSDMVIRDVVKEYKKNVAFATDAINKVLTRIWYENAQILRNRLIEIITETDALTDEQRENLAQIIINYQPLEIEDVADAKFAKKKFLKGMLFGIKINNSERIDLKALSNKYNKWINDNIDDIANSMNSSCYASFDNWREGLNIAIENNITDLNPNLRNISDLILEETEKINELARNKARIGEALENIKDLMSWTSAE